MFKRVDCFVNNDKWLDGLEKKEMVEVVNQFYTRMTEVINFHKF